MEAYLIPIVVIAIMSLLVAASKKRPKLDENGNSILKLPIFYSLIGIATFFSGFGLIYYLIFRAQENEIIPVVVSTLVLFAVGILLYLKGSLFSITILDNGIKEKTMFGKIKCINWSEMESITFGKTSLELKIISHKTQIKAHMHMRDFPYLVEKIEENTRRTKKEMGIVS